MRPSPHRSNSRHGRQNNREASFTGGYQPRLTRTSGWTPARRTHDGRNRKLASKSFFMKSCGSLPAVKPFCAPGNLVSHPHHSPKNGDYLRAFIPLSRSRLSHPSFPPLHWGVGSYRRTPPTTHREPLTLTRADVR